MVWGHGGLCAHRHSLGEPGGLTHTGRQNLLSAQEAEAAVLPSLVTLSVWPEIFWHEVFPQTLIVDLFFSLNV